VRLKKAHLSASSRSHEGSAFVRRREGDLHRACSTGSFLSVDRAMRKGRAVPSPSRSCAEPSAIADSFLRIPRRVVASACLPVPCRGSNLHQPEIGVYLIEKDVVHGTLGKFDLHAVDQQLSNLLGGDRKVIALGRTARGRSFDHDACDSR
jgi:hypothetical protein